MSKYDDHMSGLESRIYDLKLLRDAQWGPDSDGNHERIQQQITGLTNELFAWQDAAPAMYDLDCQIQQAQVRASQAWRKVDEDALRGAKVCGVAGGLCLFVAIIWGPSVWVAIAAVVFLGAAVVALMRGIPVRRTQTDAANQAKAEVEALFARRDYLKPTPGGARREVQTVAVTVVEVPELEDVEVD